MSSLIQKAWAFGEYAHRHQKRKYSGEPYFRHPVRVMEILKSVKIENEEVLAAALLHDTMEDCEVQCWQLERMFGGRVADLVWEVTDVSIQEEHRSKNRKTRKELDREHLALSSVDAANIKLADLIDNSDDILQHDKNFARVYMREKAALLEVLRHGHVELFNRATEMVVSHQASLA